MILVISVRVSLPEGLFNDCYGGDLLSFAEWIIP